MGRFPVSYSEPQAGEGDRAAAPDGGSVRVAAEMQLVP